MCSCRPFAERRRRHRAMSLIEVMTSQVIVIILVTSLVGLVAAMVKKLHSEAGVSDANVHLRQATHFLLRDTQAVGGDQAMAGDVVIVTDGGATGPDTLTLFKRDEALCNGGLGGITQQPGNSRVLRVADVNGACPITDEPGNCSEDELRSRRVTVKGGAFMAIAVPTSPNEQPCQITFGTADNQQTVNQFNTRYGTTYNNIGQVFSAMPPPLQVLVGSAYTWRLNGTTLERSVNGSAFEPILDNVYDFQIERIYDINGNATYLDAQGLFEPGEVVTVSDGAPLPVGATAENFLGLRIGLMTFSRAADGMDVRPPVRFSNRHHDDAPRLRRYRESFVLAAARNRIGQ
jgi:hypothetical protein